jgi:hypothetical protein
MKIYKISQNVNNDYDTYDSAIVYAETAEDARRIHPSSTWTKGGFYDEEKKEFWTEYAGSNRKYLFEDNYGSWTNDLTSIRVERNRRNKRKCRKRVLILASFNAG